MVARRTEFPSVCNTRNSCGCNRSACSTRLLEFIEADTWVPLRFTWCCRTCVCSAHWHRFFRQAAIIPDRAIENFFPVKHAKNPENELFSILLFAFSACLREKPDIVVADDGSFPCSVVSDRQFGRVRNSETFFRPNVFFVDRPALSLC